MANSHPPHAQLQQPVQQPVHAVHAHAHAHAHAHEHSVVGHNVLAVASAELLNSIPFADLLYRARTRQITWHDTISTVAFAVYQDRVRRNKFSLPDMAVADWLLAEDLLRKRLDLLPRQEYWNIFGAE